MEVENSRKAAPKRPTVKIFLIHYLLFLLNYIRAFKSSIFSLYSHPLLSKFHRINWKLSGIVFPEKKEWPPKKKCPIFLVRINP